MRTPSDNRTQQEAIKQLLAGAPTIQTPCDLDLMIFLHRHPRALLTSEQLSGFVGYNLKEIAQALDAFIEAGLLARTAQQATHAARFFVLQLDGPQGGGIRALVELGSTREGRRSVLRVLNGGGPRGNQSGGGPKLRLVKRA